MIKHFCDGCYKEVKTYATLHLYPKWKRVQDHGGVPNRYILCNECYERLKMIIPEIPDNGMEIKV